MFLKNILDGLEMNSKKSFGKLDTNLDLMKISWGICVPKSCTVKELREIWNFTRSHYELKFDVRFDENFCDYEGKLILSGFAIFAIVFLCAFGAIIVGSALYDIVVYQKSGRKDTNLIVAFSAYTNAKQILTTKASDNSLQCLNGIRVISIVWIISAHRFMFAHYHPHINGNKFQEWTTELRSTIIMSATLAVDTFFVISGLLLSYLFLQNHKRGTKLKVLPFYLRRILRLTPSLAVVVLIFSSLVSYLGSGPFYHIVYDMFQKSCETNWWATLLYVQNYVCPETYCVGHAWYLAVDTQLYFLSPLILVPMTKWPRNTTLAVALLALASAIAVFVRTWFLKLGSTYMESETAEHHSLYISTHLRASSWLIGIIMGYVMHTTRKLPMKINRLIVFLVWILSLSMLMTIVFGHLSFTTKKYNVFRSAIFNSLSRPSWCLGVSWIIFACVNGYGGIINDFLSLPVFNFLIKINYNMYLLHILPLIYFSSQIRMNNYFSPILEMYSVLSDVVVTVLLAFIWTLAFESPVIAIERFFSKRGARALIAVHEL